MEDDDWTLPILIGLGLGVLFTLFIMVIFDDSDYRIEELGKSICEEEYGMDYESYYDGTLRCKPFTESYDGIKVEVPKAQTTKAKASYS